MAPCDSESESEALVRAFVCCPSNITFLGDREKCVLATKRPKRAKNRDRETSVLTWLMPGVNQLTAGWMGCGGVCRVLGTRGAWRVTPPVYT
ncbi:hypothetical protein BaRGS_00005712, partial [Batillaria attramentaria]